MPSTEELTSTIDLSNPDNPTALSSWRQAIHRCLSYACHDDSTAAERAGPTAQLIGDALQWYLTHEERLKPSGGEDAVVCTVVESIWLTACLLDDKSPGYKSLIEIVTHLVGRKTDVPENEESKTSQPLLSPSLLQTSLEFSFLQDANLLPPAVASKAPKKKKEDPSISPVLASAKQKYMKVNANLYYRQHKFNMFVEESEGWAKLLSFLIHADSSDNSTKHIRSLTGAFDLDPNRVLDVALDFLEWTLNGIVVKNVKDNNPSSTSFAEIRNTEDGASWGLDAIHSAMNKCNSYSRVNSLLGIIRELDGTNTGGRAVAHLLGFKYRSYYSRGSGAAKSASNAATTQQVFPQSLYLSTAFLSIHNLVDVHALLPHLTPLDKDKTSLMELYQTHCADTVARLKKMGIISLNSKTAKEDKTATVTDEQTADPFVNDPIVGIFRSLLAVGDWNDAVAFLANASSNEFGEAVLVEDALKVEMVMNSVMLAACSLSDSVALDACAWVSRVLEEESGGKMSDSDSPLEDLSSELLGPLTCLAGSGKICLSQPLYTKLCGLYRSKFTAMKQCAEVEESSIDAETFAVLSNFLVPSLSLFPSDPALPRELWSVLQLLPYSIRYKLYSSWRSPALEKGALRSMTLQDVKSCNFSKPLAVIESEIKTGIETRSVMKRISKENIREKGIELARTSHNNPLVVFSYILQQIESYDNMILMMVDTFAYVTALGLDVIGYCLLLSLGGGDDGSGKRSRTKTGGLNTEQWLASLETFTGAFYKKFPDVELRGLLLYITQRLKEGDVSELGVLSSLIKTAGGYGFVGYDSTSALSELQLDGRCGSRLLKLETSSFGVVDDVNPRSSRTLKTVLQGGDLGIIMLLLISQIRQQILYSKSESKEHIKVLGSMYDDCESVLCLLLEFVSDSSDDQPSGPSTKEKFAQSMPPLVALCDNYGLDTATAWMLVRPLVRKSMFYMDDKKMTSSSEPPAFLQPFTPTPEMTGSYQKLLPESAWKYITPALFEAYFSLSVYDIQCPTERYNSEINRLKKEVERLTQLQKGGSEARGAMAALAAAAAAAGGSEAQIRRATEFTQANKTELDRLKHNVEKLSKDFSRQQKRCELVHGTLEKQKDELISHDGSNGGFDENFTSSFMSSCIYPRFLLSPEDALFSAYFVKLLHKMKVARFSMIELVDCIVNAATGSLYCVSEDEAGNLAIFLHEIWASVNSWRYDNDAFTSELKGTPGSQVSKAFAQEKDLSEHSFTDGITHDDYKNLYSQWHLKLGSAAVGCLNSSEFMHTRSALILLSRIVLVYPTQPRVGDKLLDILTSLQADESRPDIRATAQGYASQLAKARDEGMWKEENIAVTKARQEREQMKVEERRKKLAAQHEEMKKESEMITSQLGDAGTSWRRGGGRDDPRGRPYFNEPRANSQMTSPPLSAHAPKFVPRDGGEARELNAAPQRRDGPDHSRSTESRRSGPDREWERDRGGGPVHSRHHDNRGSRDAHDNRRHGDDSGATRRKRSRSPEPGEEERDMQKRFKGRNSPPRGSSRGDRGNDERWERRGGSGGRR